MTPAPSTEPMHTDRLTIRMWEPADADRLFAIRSLESVAKWLGDPTVWTERATAVAMIAAWSDQTETEAVLGKWAVVHRETSVLVGAVHLARLKDSDEHEIGWYLHPDSTGNGYATEAAAIVLQRALDARIGRVWAIMWPHNEPSAQVAQRIGMTDHGICDDPWYGTVEEPTSRMLSIQAD